MYFQEFNISYKIVIALFSWIQIMEILEIHPVSVYEKNPIKV